MADIVGQIAFVCYGDHSVGMVGVGSVGCCVVGSCGFGGLWPHVGIVVVVAVLFGARMVLRLVVAEVLL